jgi:cephalosporin-C deacetylase
MHYEHAWVSISKRTFLGEARYIQFMPKVSWPCSGVFALVVSFLIAPSSGGARQESGLDAVRRVSAVEIFVSPDHSDWKYKAGEKVRFTVRAMRDGSLAAGLSLTYTIGPEQMPPTITKTVVLTGEPLNVDGGTMSQPGFLRCTASIEANGITYRGLGTAGIDPEKIEAVAQAPADFDAFWQAGKDELAAVPMEAERKLVPELSTAKANVYSIRLQNVGRNKGGRSYIFGMLAEPVQPGKYPAMLNIPGAGVYKIQPMVKQAEQGVITLAIGIHGIPLNMDAAVYPILAQNALSGYWLWGFESRERYYYRHVILGCLRANDYLTSLPEWNGKTLLVTGESQGGGLTVITTALDSRVTGLAPMVPAFSDLTAYLKGRAGGWPHMFKADGPDSMRTPAYLTTAGYYDAVNFARRIKVPGLYIWGYNDETCPPTSTYALYNSVTAPKKLFLTLAMGHHPIPETSAVVESWRMKFLKTGEAPAEF